MGLPKMRFHWTAGVLALQASVASSRYVDMNGVGIDSARGGLTVATNQDIAQAVITLRGLLADTRSDVLDRLREAAEVTKKHVALTADEVQSDLGKLKNSTLHHAKDLAAMEIQQEVAVKHGNLGRCCCQEEPSQAGFDHFDVDHNGKIDGDELRQGLRFSGSNTTEDIIDEALKAADVDHDSMLTTKEYMSVLTRLKFPSLEDAPAISCHWHDMEELEKKQPSTHHCPESKRDYMQLEKMGKDLLLIFSSSIACAQSVEMPEALEAQIYHQLMSKGKI